MIDIHTTVDINALLTYREVRLDTALEQWSDLQATDGLLSAMRTQVASLALGGVILRLVTEITTCCSAAGLVLLAEQLLDGRVTFEEALAISRDTRFSDGSRLFAMLYACGDQKLHENAVDIIVLRLVGDSATDPELSSRSYLRLGDLIGADSEDAGHAYAAALDKSLETTLPSLQANCLMKLAKYALHINRPDEAAENAAVARVLYERDGDPKNAAIATITEALGRLEKGDPTTAAGVLRPVVARQMREGLIDVGIDATEILEHCIRAAAKPAFLQAQSADPEAVEIYDRAVALAGDTGYLYPDEAADRTLIGACLVRGSYPGAGALQLEKACDIARHNGDEVALLKALVSRCDWLVHSQDSDALAATSEALELARAGNQSEVLPMLISLHGSALCQAGRIDEALRAYEEANRLEFRLACQVRLIVTLFSAGRDKEAVRATEDLIAAMKQNAPETSSDYDQHLALLLNSLTMHGHSGLAQHLIETLEYKGSPTQRKLGSAQRIFVDEAYYLLAKAGAHLSAARHEEVALILVPLLQQAKDRGETAVMLSTTSMLGENALNAGNFDEALTYLQTVVDATTDEMPMKAGALNKIGTVYCVGYKRYELAFEYQARAIELQRARHDMRGLVVSLIQAAQTCLALDRLELADAYAEELRELGPQYPPQDVEWVDYVIALVDAYQNRWDRARPRFQDTIRELERRRTEYTGPQVQHQWCRQKANMYGNAIEAAIAGNYCQDAIVYLELARNRYLTGVAKAHGIKRRNGIDLQQALINRQEISVANMLQDIVTPNSAIVWCGGFPLGLGIVSARRDGNDISFSSSFSRDINGNDLTDLFEGDVRRMVAAHEQGGAVEWIHQMTLSNRELNLGANPYLQDHGNAWNRSMGAVVEAMGQSLWPRILATVGGSVSNIVLLPSVGCSELPLCAAAPERWPDGTPLVTSTASSIDSLLPLEGTSPSRIACLIQVENPSEDPDLLCSPIEASTVRRLFEGEVQVLRGRRASTQRVAEALRNAKVFHFIGHAFFDWSDPLDSGLVCANRKDGPSALSVREIFQLVGSIYTPLIVLSACQIGNVRPGDTQNDFLNLPSALVAAGARTVIAPRWQVDDVATSMLLSNMFERWRRERISIGAALNAARLWLRDEVTRVDVERWLAHSENALDANRLTKLASCFAETFQEQERPFAHVAYWGAFELTGDFRLLGVE